MRCWVGFGLLLVWSVLSCSSQARAPSVDPFSDTAREGFVRGCVAEGRRSVGEDLARSLCSCAIDYFGKELDADTYRRVSADLSKGVLSAETTKALSHCFGKEADVANGYPQEVRAVVLKHCMDALTSRGNQSDDPEVQERRRVQDTSDCDCVLSHVEQSVPLEQLIGSVGPDGTRVALFEGVLEACRKKDENKTVD